MTTITLYARNAFNDNPAVTLGALVVLLCVALSVARRALRSKRAPRLFAKLVMLLALGWSAEVMFHIVRVQLAQGWGPTIAMFGVFEAAFLLAAQRAEQHMARHEWPGHHLRTVVGVAVVMSCVGFLASHSGTEAFIRIAVPLIAVKVWRDGLYDGRETKPTASSWLWTPRNLAIYLGALRPGENDVSAISRERVIARMVRLEFKRRHGDAKRRDRYAERLMRLSLQADDAMVREVRARVDRAQWFTVAPLRAARTAERGEVTQAARKPAAQVTRPATRELTPFGDPAAKAAIGYRTGEFTSLREAAQWAGVSEGTIRYRLARLPDAEVTQLPAQEGEPVAA
jgi:hypothetical protein